MDLVFTSLDIYLKCSKIFQLNKQKSPKGLAGWKVALQSYRSKLIVAVVAAPPLPLPIGP